MPVEPLVDLSSVRRMIEGQIASIRRICREPGASAVARELGAVRIETLEGVLLALDDDAVVAHGVGGVVVTDTDRAITGKAWTWDDVAEYRIPESLQAGLARYLKQHIRPGHFLCAILENDLRMAFLRASDAENEAAIPRILRFLINEASSNVHGSRAVVDAWVDARPPREES
jgi:hypothetical protein